MCDRDLLAYLYNIPLVLITDDPGVTGDCLSERARRRFECALENVVSVPAPQTIDMETKSRGLGPRTPKVFRQLDREIADCSTA
jgi:hypothetical protein